MYLSTFYNTRLCISRPQLLVERPIFNNIVFNALLICWFSSVEKAISMGMDRKMAVWLVSTIGLTNTFGRVICGWISSYESVDAIVLNNVSLTFGGLYTVLLPFLPYSMVSYYLYASLFGFSMGEHHGLTQVRLINRLHHSHAQYCCCAIAKFN